MLKSTTKTKQISNSHNFKRIGLKLMTARRKAGYSRKETADRLSIDRKTIKQIDLGEIDAIQTAKPMARIIREYAILVGLNPAPITHHFNHKPPLFFHKPRLFVLSKMGVLIAVGIVILLAGSFLGWRTYNALGSPSLIIYSPGQLDVSNKPEVLISGRPSTQAQVFINGVNVPVDAGGNFGDSVILSAGVNDIEISAVNSLGRSTTTILTVLYQPG